MSRKPWFLVFAVLVTSFLFAGVADAQKPKSNKTKTEKTPPPVSENKVNFVKIPPLSNLETEILAEINLVRKNPAEYAKILEGMRRYYNGKTYTAPGRKAFNTNEGLTAVDEAIEALKKAAPLGELKSICSTVRASRDHLTDLQKSGAFSHSGSDGSSPQDRLKKYVGGKFYSSENIIGRSGTARDIVLMMILDDGVPTRTHRKNLLDSRFRFAGISNGRNSKGLNLTIIVFSDSEQDIEPCKMKN